MPRAASSWSKTFLSSAAQPPQPVLALVVPLTAPRSSQPASMAALMAPLVTLWHEQMVALSGRASGPSAGAGSLEGTINEAGSAGRSRPLA